MPRLFWKLFFALWLSIMGFAVIMAAVNNILVQSSMPEEVAERSRDDIGAIEKRLSAAIRKQGPQAAAKVMRALPRQIQGRVFLFDEDGKELAGREIKVERLRSRQAQFNSRRILDADGNTYRLVVVRRTPRETLLEPGRRGMAWRLLIAAVVSALVSFVIARYLAAPLVHLGAASRSLAQGDLSTRIGLPLTKRKDEFGKLAKDFDEMASRLQLFQTANRRLLRDVSHELRSPLARLRVALEIARNRQSGEVSGELNRIELESERLETLVDEVLGLLRQSSESIPLKKEQFDLVELLEDLEEVVRYEIPEGQPGLHLRTDASVPINADRELLWRALENLIRNALVHTTDSGEVEIEARRSKDGQRTDVFVRDSGSGIPPQHLEHIFKPFYRVQEARDRDTGGHGLGLAIALAAIQRHGGSITAENRDSGGLEIHITFPA